MGCCIIIDVSQLIAPPPGFLLQFVRFLLTNAQYFSYSKSPYYCYPSLQSTTTRRPLPPFHHVPNPHSLLPLDPNSHSPFPLVRVVSLCAHYLLLYFLALWAEHCVCVYYSVPRSFRTLTTKDILSLSLFFFLSHSHLRSSLDDPPFPLILSCWLISLYLLFFIISDVNSRSLNKIVYIVPKV